MSLSYLATKTVESDDHEDDQFYADLFASDSVDSSEMSHVSRTDVDPHEIEIRVKRQLTLAGVEPNRTLEKLRLTRSAISGSTMLPILLDLKFKPNDLDVYANEQGGEVMLAHMHDEEEFKSVKTIESTGSSYTRILRIHWLVKEDHLVNLIIVPDDNPVVAIFHFHSTIVMNCLTGYGVFCAYPALTLNRKSISNTGVLHTDESRRRADICYTKYISRGIEHQPHLRHHGRWAHHQCGADKSCPATIRSMHDEESLWIGLPSVVGVGREQAVYNNSESVIWSLGGWECSPTRHYNMTTTISVPIATREIVPALEDSDNVQHEGEDDLLLVSRSSTL
ncbi:hypothetical protein R3P38DRAFT_2975646, partial [Favolaschia claudopus]